MSLQYQMGSCQKVSHTDGTILRKSTFHQTIHRGDVNLFSEARRDCSLEKATRSESNERAVNKTNLQLISIWEYHLFGARMRQVNREAAQPILSNIASCR